MVTDGRPAFFMHGSNTMGDDWNGPERRTGFMIDTELRVYLDGMKKDFIDAIKSVENHIKELVESQIKSITQENEHQRERTKELYELDREHRKETATKEKDVEGRLSNLEANQVSRRFLIPVLVTIGLGIIGVVAAIIIG